MKIHVFNPEHDIALANSTAYFTPPHAARELRSDLGFIAALWADDGDMVLVDDKEYAMEAVRHVSNYAADVSFVTMNDLKNVKTEMTAGCSIHPWGWDISIKRQFFSANTVFIPLLPTNGQLMRIKEMSNRRFAAESLLAPLRESDRSLTGESVWVSDFDSVADIIMKNKRSVLKAPWSCSGRGVRYVCDRLDDHQAGWCRNVILKQGGVMVEPFYNKVVDFGMEFTADGKGRADYCGLSLFRTVNGAYTGNILATEKDKLGLLARYVDETLLANVRDTITRIMGPALNDVYSGPFGVDMMVVTGPDDGFCLHPCVEMNLRRTMGHVALGISPSQPMPKAVMNIGYDGRYRLRISRTGDDILNNSLMW